MTRGYAIYRDLPNNGRVYFTGEDWEASAHSSNILLFSSEISAYCYIDAKKDSNQGFEDDVRVVDLLLM